MVSFDILKSIYNSVIIFDLTGEKNEVILKDMM